MNTQIRISQIIGCLIVVIGHSIPDFKVCPKWILEIHKILYIFNMPLFFVISGYLTFNIEKLKSESLNSFIKKKFVKILVPYFILNSIAYIPKILLNKYSERTVNLDFLFYLQSFISFDYIIIKFLWFLPIIFIMNVIFFISRDLFTQSNIIIDLLIFSLLIIFSVILNYDYTLPFEIDLLFGNLHWFVFGIFFKKYNFLFFVNRLHQFTSPLILLTILSIYYSQYNHLNIYSTILLAYLIILLIFKLSFSLIGFFEKHILINNFSSYYYQIYLLSWFFMIPIRILYSMKIFTFEITIILMFFCGTFLPYLFCLSFLAKSKLLRLFIGLNTN